MNRLAAGHHRGGEPRFELLHRGTQPRKMGPSVAINRASIGELLFTAPWAKGGLLRIAGTDALPAPFHLPGRAIW